MGLAIPCVTGTVKKTIELEGITVGGIKTLTRPLPSGAPGLLIAATGPRERVTPNDDGIPAPNSQSSKEETSTTLRVRCHSPE